MKNILFSLILMFGLGSMAKADVWSEVQSQPEVKATIIIVGSGYSWDPKINSYRVNRFLIKDGIIYFTTHNGHKKHISSMFSVEI